MRKRALFLAAAVCSILAAQGQETVTLTFTGATTNHRYVQLDQVAVHNISKGWMQTLNYPDTMLVLTVGTRIEENTFMRDGLEQNFPNPFSGQTTATLNLPQGGPTLLQVFDMNGKLCASFSENLPTGKYKFNITLSTSNIYFLKATTPYGSKAVKMINTGQGSGNRIDLVGMGEWEMKAVIDLGDFPFSVGDTIRFLGYSNNTASTPILKQQLQDELITLVFDLEEFQCGNALTDIDGNSYPTVQLGSQCWMAANLRTSHYDDGTPLAPGSEPSLSAPYHYYPGNQEYNQQFYGKLYNRMAAVREPANGYENTSTVQGICPSGWHIPSSNEWQVLSQWVSRQSSYLCGNTSQAIAKALASQYGWNYSPIPCTAGSNPATNNATGFGATASGCFDGSHRFLNDKACFWSSSEMGAQHFTKDSTILIIDYRCITAGSDSCARIPFYVNSYSDGDTIASGQEILAVGLNIEHSYNADLDIYLACPDNRRTLIKSYTSNHYLGNPCTIFNGCLFEDNIQGTGWNYFWSENSSYATILTGNFQSHTVTISGNSTASIDSSDVFNRTNYYQPVESFDRLIGCPKNGKWEIRVYDRLGGDNGFIFSASLVLPTNGSIILRADSSGLCYSGDDVRSHGYAVRCVKGNTPPQITTTELSNLMHSSATFSNTVMLDGGAPVTQRGFCYSTSPNPTMDDAHVSCGSGVGPFTGDIRRLRPLTTYYLRACASNSVGTTYSEEVCFTTPDVECPATVTDIDGNVYPITRLGSQCWMAENLRTTRFSNGMEIDLGTEASESTGYRYYPNDNEENVPEYGYLYNWKAVMRNSSSSSANPSGVLGVCPEGWHVPSAAEWEQMMQWVKAQPEYVCGTSNDNISKALCSPNGWDFAGILDGCAPATNSETNNATGFNALPAGWEWGEEGWGLLAAFWSSTANSNKAYSMLLEASSPYPYFNCANRKRTGMSVRCVLD